MFNLILSDANEPQGLMRRQTPHKQSTIILAILNPDIILGLGCVSGLTLTPHQIRVLVNPDLIITIFEVCASM